MNCVAIQVEVIEMRKLGDNVWVNVSIAKYSSDTDQRQHFKGKWRVVGFFAKSEWRVSARLMRSVLRGRGHQDVMGPYGFEILIVEWRWVGWEMWVNMHF